MEEQVADLRSEVAARDERAATVKAVDLLLWPDESARALGRVFAVALGAVRNAGGRDWREDPSAPVILAGVMRRAMDRCSRMGSLAAELLDRERIAVTTETVAASLAGFIDETMPPLPPLQPQDDPANWTMRARSAVTFRDKASGELLQVVTGPEYDIADPEAVRDLGPDYRAALDRFRPIRDTVDAEDFIVFALKDGSTSWERLGKGGAKIHVPAGQDAPSVEPRPEPPVIPVRLIGEEAAAADAPNWRQPRGMLPASIDDQATGDEAIAGLPLVKAEKASRKRAMELDAAEPEAAPTPKRGHRAKVTA